MLNQIRNRNMTRDQWDEIRSKVRKHVLLHSQQALEKRMLLSDKKVLMGGIVVKKQNMAVVLGDKDSNLYQARCALPIESALQEMEQMRLSGSSPVLEGAGVDFLVYDFSGFFKVNGSITNLDRDLRRKMYQIKEGDVIFVSGDVVSMNSPEGYDIHPSNFYSEEEILFYRRVCSERYDKSREEMDGIKKQSFIESDEQTLLNARNPWDIVKLFLNPENELKGNDYYWLESAAKDFFDKTKDIRAARLVLKYYLVHIQEEKKRYLEEGNGFYPLDIQELFFDIYPNLHGVVEWPQEH